MKTIILEAVGPNKIQIIRIIRQYTGTGLKEAKDAVELINSGTNVAITAVPKEQVSSILNEFAQYGATANEMSDGHSITGLKEMQYRQQTKAGDSVLVEKEKAPQTKSSLPSVRCQAPVSKTDYHIDKSLKGYLREVTSLECQALTQTRLMNQLTRRANSLGNAQYIEEPDAPRYDSWNGNIVGSIALVAIVEGLIVGLLLKVYVIFAISMLLIFLDLLPDIIRHSLKLKKHKRVIEKYKEELKADAVRVEKELVLRKEVLRQYNAVQTERERTNRALKSLYAVGIIHSDYHNFVAVSSIYDYLDKGICSKLTGRDGAYAFYEEALRFKRIETRLDVIINKLDEIIENQQHIAYLIKDGNATLHRIEQQNNRMAASLDRIEENTVATEYNTRCAAHSAAVMESIAVYRTLRYD